MTDGIRRIHHASTPRATFNAGIRDAAHEALMALHNEKAQSSMRLKVSPLPKHGSQKF
jgi:hypothetical protein